MEYTELLDLRGLPCPGNLPRVLMCLETLGSGDTLLVLLDDIIALDRIPSGLEDETDYKLEKITRDDDMIIRVYIRVL